VVGFVLGYIIKTIAQAMRVKPKTSVSLVLMGTMKNYGLASGILLTLFNERSAIPASILMVFGVLQMIWLVYLFPRSETSQD
jgi:BASS family bile acid:Na+ symporter